MSCIIVRSETFQTTHVLSIQAALERTHVHKCVCLLCSGGAGAERAGRAGARGRGGRGGAHAGARARARVRARLGAPRPRLFTLPPRARQRALHALQEVNPIYLF